MLSSESNRYSARDRAHDRVDGLVLADDPGLEPFLHLEDAVTLGFGDLVHRDAGHLGDNGGDVLGGHGVAAALLAGEVQPHHGPGLVHRVDGLVRQGLVGEIAVGEPDGGLHGLVRIGDVVEFLVMGFQVAEDLDGLRHVRGLHDDFLEAAVQGAVLLHDLRELVHRGRAHALEFAAGEGRLEHVRRVQAARGAAGAHDGVELVDEQDQVRIRLGFLDDGLEAFLEVATVFGAGHHRSDVQREDAFLREGGGDVPGGDPQGNALDDGGFAHAGLADEHRVVLLAPPQDLDHAGDLHVTPHDRVQFPFAGRLRQVIAEFLDVDAFLLGRFTFLSFLLAVALGGLLLLLLDLQQAFGFHEREHAAVVHPAVAEEGLAVAVRGAAQGEQEVVRGRLRALQAGGFHHRDAQDVLRLAGKVDVVDFGVGDGLVGENPAVDEGLEFGGFDAEPLQHLESGVVLVADDPEEEVVRADAVAAGAHRLFAGVFDDAVQLVGNLYHMGTKISKIPGINNRAGNRFRTICQSLMNQEKMLYLHVYR